MPARCLLSKGTLHHRVLHGLGNTKKRRLCDVTNSEWSSLEPTRLPRGLARKVSQDCLHFLRLAMDTFMESVLAIEPDVETAFDWQGSLEALRDRGPGEEKMVPIKVWLLCRPSCPLLRTAWGGHLLYPDDGSEQLVLRRVTMHNLADEQHLQLHTHSGKRFDNVMPACPFYMRYEMPKEDRKNARLLDERDMTIVHDLPLLPSDEKRLRQIYRDACGQFLTTLLLSALPDVILADVTSHVLRVCDERAQAEQRAMP